MAAMVIEMNIPVYSPAELMKKFLDEIYPSLFTKSAELISLAVRLSCTNTENDPAVTAEKIFRETDALYQKEKLVLFPFIAGLLRDGKKSESCAPFKNVKLHYTALLSLIQAMRAELKEIPGEEKAVMALSAGMDAFEKTLIHLQKTKDQYLFGPLRSCSGCTKLKVES